MSELAVCFTCGLLEDTIREEGCPEPLTTDPCLYMDALAEEAERDSGLDQPPVLPEVWVAELVLDGKVTGRVVLTSRADAEQALAAHWRFVRYVRADLAVSNESERGVLESEDRRPRSGS